MRYSALLLWGAAALLAPATAALAAADAPLREYRLEIGYKTLSFSGRQTRAMAINNSIPGPVLRFREGETARIHVRNNMDVESSVHWHGLLLPNSQDGVPYLTTAPILPGATATYEFPLRHAGTYWYHSHTGLQEQRGVYGAIVIEPSAEAEALPQREYHRELVLVLSDWTDEEPRKVLRALKRNSHYYSLKKGAMQSVLGALRNRALGETLEMARVRMPPMDISDVGYDYFLSNGAPRSSFAAEAGERVLLRVINAAASTYFYLDFAAAPLRVIAADGLDVEPWETPRLLMAIAETYDVLIEVPPGGAYELRATAQDGSGSTGVFIGRGERVSAAPVPPPDLYRMHAGHDTHAGHDMRAGHDASRRQGLREEAPGGAHQQHSGEMPHPRPQAPYGQLRALQPTALPAHRPWREYSLVLNGDMQRYVWMINDRALHRGGFLHVRKGENVRFVLENETMMHHPMHLHGHFFRVLNGQGEYAPLKHTVDVPPMGRRVIEFQADEDFDWFFHCHILYHMAAGMARVVHYEQPREDGPRGAVRRLSYLRTTPVMRDAAYLWGDVLLLSQLGQLEMEAVNTRNSLEMSWQQGWQAEHQGEQKLREGQLLYRRYHNRFLDSFLGLSYDEHLKERAVLGVDYLLPWRLESRLWADDAGHARLALERVWQLSDRLEGTVEYHHDTSTKSEWQVEFSWTLGRRLSLVTAYHSEIGAGAGLHWSW